MNPKTFLAEYWQKKPCVMRQAFPGFRPLLDRDDLAGLACEQVAESRLVRGSMEAADWEVWHGPFSEASFSRLPNSNWTLLVQDVEKHYGPLQALMHQFDFIPQWRLDDLMISFAATGGSVGPHADEYDVFLLQAEGKRRWQIAATFDPALLPGCALKVLRHFSAEREWVLEPGDLLYLPPRVAHYGLALEPCMTWSIGARAPSAADLLQAHGEWLAQADDQGGFYTDPDLQAPGRAGEVTPQALAGLRELMRAGIRDDEETNTFLAAFLSRFRLAHEPAEPPHSVTAGRVFEAIKNGQRLLRNPWTRLTWIEIGAGARLLAAGQPHECSVELAEALCEWEQPRLSLEMLDRRDLDVLTELLNQGHFSL